MSARKQRLHKKSRTRIERVQLIHSSPVSQPAATISSLSLNSSNLPINSVFSATSTETQIEEEHSIAQNILNAIHHPPAEVSSFLEWVLERKSKLKKQHYIITKIEYDTIVYCLKNLNLVEKDNKFRWALRVIKDHQYTLSQIHTPEAVVDVVVQSDFATKRYL
jgi:hypothetical protein